MLQGYLDPRLAQEGARQWHVLFLLMIGVSVVHELHGVAWPRSHKPALCFNTGLCVVLGVADIQDVQGQQEEVTGDIIPNTMKNCYEIEQCVNSLPFLLQNNGTNCCGALWLLCIYEIVTGSLIISS